MHSVIYIFALRKFQIYFTIFFLCFSTLVQAQTYSSEEIVISGLGFARFSVALVPEKSFTDHMDAKRWLRIIDRNLCWSGVFLVTDSRYRTCRTADGNQVDMKIMLKLKGTVTDNGDLVPKHLMLTVADNDGAPLFPLELPIRKNRFREAELMDLINEMSVQLTGLNGILGSTIAFTLKQPKRRKIIARINTHGKKLAAVSRNKYINLLPSWSPKGDAIVYTTLSRRGTAIMFNDCLKVVGCKYRPVKLLSSNISAARISKNFLSVSGGTWFSNGHKLIVTLSRKGNSDLYEFDRLKRKVIRLTTHRAIDTVPDLSPDNQHLIFVSDRSGHEQIHYMKLGTKIPFQLTDSRGSSSDPVWSPDGTLIAFSKISSGHSQIHLMDPFTGEDNFLTRGRFNSEQPSWSPDGRQIAFVSSSTGVDKLYIMFIDGTGRRRLTRTPRDFEEGGPSWTARKF
ncbi:MAG: hypothetical protein VX927_05410 [SAR324 cluster bacterium]|nr:hypothetical protein [SAR324 cluster bacterium]